MRCHNVQLVLVTVTMQQLVYLSRNVQDLASDAGPTSAVSMTFLCLLSARRAAVRTEICKVLQSSFAVKQTQMCGCVSHT